MVTHCLQPVQVMQFNVWVGIRTLCTAHCQNLRAMLTCIHQNNWEIYGNTAITVINAMRGLICWLCRMHAGSRDASRPGALSGRIMPTSNLFAEVQNNEWWLSA